MSLEYSITYTAENTYENWVRDAYWQFLIIPQQNGNQQIVGIEFNNSLKVINEYSVNGYGFRTIRVHPKQRFKQISFEARFKLIKNEVNPFGFTPDESLSEAYGQIRQLDFKVGFERFLRNTRFTDLPDRSRDAFVFDTQISIFENCKH